MGQRQSEEDEINIQTLTIDPLIGILLNLSPSELSHYCRSSSEINQLCNSDIFLNEYVIRKYGLNLNIFPGGTAQERYRWLIENNDNAYRLSRYVVERGDPLNIGRVIDYYGVNKIFTPILVTAVESQNLRIVQITLNELLKRIPPGERIKYNSDYLDPVLLAVEEGYTDIFQFLMSNYKPEHDPKFLEGIRSFVGALSANPEYFLPYIPQTPENEWLIRTIRKPR